MLFHLRVPLQKLTKDIWHKAVIPALGDVVLCLGLGGAVTTVPYTTDRDGRMTFNTQAWRDFLMGKNLQEKQAVLITFRETRRRPLKVMIVMEIGRAHV